MEATRTPVRRCPGCTNTRDVASIQSMWLMPMETYDTRGKSNCPTDGSTDAELIADGGTGAVDNDYDEGLQDARRAIQQGIADREGEGHDALAAGDIAIDLVKRQPVYVIGRVAEDCIEYYEQEGFDLVNYKTHPYLGVTPDDAVFECVFIGGLDDLHRFSDTYDYPETRLARVPVEIAWSDDDA